MAKSALAIKPKKKTARTSNVGANIMYKKYLGQEPKNIENSISAQSRALTWYNYICTTEDAKEWLLEYIEKHHADVSKQFDINNKNYSNTYGWIARMSENAISVPAVMIESLENFIKSNLTKTKRSLKVSAPVEAAVVAPKDRLEEFLPEFEEALDKLDKSFNPYTYLTARNVPQIYASRIADYYRPVKDELDLAVAGKDADIKHAYSKFLKTEIKIMQKFVIEIIEQCERYLGNVKKERKPRVVKKSTEQIFKHFKYMPKNDNLQLTSINPQNILTAKHLFVLNTTSNVLTMYVAKEGGLNVHRSGITNWDEKLTVSKRVGRTMKAAVDQVLNGNKKTRLNVMNTIKTAAIPSNDRINTNSILLLAIK